MTQHEWQMPKPPSPDAVLRVAPVEKLPGMFGTFIPAVSASIQIPVDIALLLSLAVVAAATRGKFDVEVKPGWVEPLSLYVMPLASSGSRKSSLVELLQRPLRDAEREAVAAALPERNAALARRRIAEQQAQTAEKAVAVAKSRRDADDAMAAVDEAQAALAKCAVPPLPRYLADDMTPEALMGLLAEQGSIASITAEGGLVGLFTGTRYNGAANLDAFLKAHSAESIRVDRKNSDPLHAERPHLVLGICAQPDVVREMKDSVELVQRGGLSRFLFANPESLVGTRTFDAPVIPQGHTEAWEQGLRALLMARGGRLTLTADALVEVQRLFEKCERFTGRTDDWFDGWLSKLTGQLVRVAALFTLFADPEARQVGVHEMRAAASLAEWLVAHAQLVQSGRDPHPNERALGWIRQQLVKRNASHMKFTTRDCWQSLKGQAWLRTSKQLAAALEQLAETGWVRRVELEHTGPGPKPEWWETHPQLLFHYDALQRGRKQ